MKLLTSAITNTSPTQNALKTEKQILNETITQAKLRELELSRDLAQSRAGMEGKEKETVSLREEERKRAIQVKGLEGELEKRNRTVIEQDLKYAGDVKSLAEAYFKLRAVASGGSEEEAMGVLP